MFFSDYFCIAVFHLFLDNSPFMIQLLRLERMLSSYLFVLLVCDFPPSIFPNASFLLLSFVIFSTFSTFVSNRIALYSCFVF